MVNGVDKKTHLHHKNIMFNLWLKHSIQIKKY